MRLEILVGVMVLLSGCASPSFKGKTLTMDYYAGSAGTVQLRPETVARLETFFATLPREKNNEPEFVQGIWVKPGLPDSLRIEAEKAQKQLQASPQAKPRPKKSYRVLDERRSVAVINVKDAPEDKWAPNGYLILEEGIKASPKSYIWLLDKRSLAELKAILDSALGEPNQSSTAQRP